MKIKKGRKNRGITSTLRSIALVPTVCMGIGSLIIASFIVYFYMTEETRDGLHNLAHSLYHTCMLAGEGDYSVEGGILFKGDNPFDTGFSIIDNIHSVSGVDATIFYGDERKATSIRKDDGTRASGTLAAPEVVRTVLKGGEDYFSEKVLVNNTPYFGYYIPLRNSDESIVGMVFVGKPRQLVIKAVMHEILMIFLLIASIGAIAMVVSLRYANNVIFSLNKIKEYLGCVAQGNVDAQISQGLAERRDEIGEIKNQLQALLVQIH